MHGITPPQMPVSGIKNVGNNGFHGEFKEYSEASGYKSYVVPYEGGRYGWYDFKGKCF